MLKRILFEADQNSGGDPDAMPEASELANELDAMKAAGEGQPAADAAQAQAPEGGEPQAAAPAAPASPEDYKKKFEEAEARFNEYQSRAQEEGFKYAEEAFKKRQAQFALQSPEAWKLVYGTEPPQGQFQSAQPAAQGNQPLTVEALQKQIAEERQWRQNFEKREAERAEQERQQNFVRETAENLRSEMAKFPDVYDGKTKMGARMIRAAADELTRRTYEWQVAGGKGPRPNVASVAADVASEFSGYWSERQQGYVNGKKQVAGSIPPTMKPGSMQPGDKPEPEITFGRRGTIRDDLGRYAAQAKTG